MSSQERYLKLAAEAKTRVREVTVEELEKVPLDPQTVIIDVREKEEWQTGHAVNAIHLSRGVLEGEIERKVPDVDTPILCYCGGGNRSALAADNLQKMGYRNVRSLAGGYQNWIKARLPVMPSVANASR